MLDFALDATFAFGLGYVVFGLAAHLAYRWQHPKVAEQPADRLEFPVSKSEKRTATASAPVPIELVKPAPQPQPTRRELLMLAKAARLPGYSRLSTAQLADALVNVRSIA